MKRLTTLLLFFVGAAIHQTGAESKPQSRDTQIAAKAAEARPSPNDKDKEQPQATVADESSEKKASALAIELKNKSAFEMEGDNRNPFWPIGWKPAEATATTTTTAERSGDIPTSAFLVSSITMDPKTRFAIINGKTMQEGQQFGLQVGTQTYQLTVKTIEDGRVILSRRNQEIILTLRRK